MTTAPDNTISQEATAYADSHAQLADELRRLDLLLAARVALLRHHSRTPDGLEANRHLYITHDEADWLLDGADPPSAEPPQVAALRHSAAQLGRVIDARVAATIAAGGALTLAQLGGTFGLSAVELDVVVICLAPELDRKYDRLYAYAQDDITRKRPSVDLALALLCYTPAARYPARALLAPHGTLLRAGIVQLVDDPHSPSGSSDLSQLLRLDRRILGYLLGHNQIDSALVGSALLHTPTLALESVPIDAALKAQLARLLAGNFDARATERRRVMLYLQGPPGVGRRELALGLCAALGCPLLYVDLEAAGKRGDELAALLRLALREGLLLQAALYIDNADMLLRDDDAARAALKALAQSAAELGWLLFMAGERPFARPQVFDQLLFHAVELPLPAAALREALWQQVLRQHAPAAEPGWAGQLAGRFRLTPEQIRAAGANAAQQAWLRADPPPALALDDLAAACRQQAQHRLGELAQKIAPRRRWGDLVLPDDTQAQLQELCLHVRQRRRVHDSWGFADRLGNGLGVSALFAGPPGTGKTMAAAIIAGELQLDLYKVDLAGVVSKYIGETEKNLGRVFEEAENSNAVLFFDEADALFGKRTEVSDAHDRYANIETSYLLQRMEQFAGVVILATNLRENMDEAFTRRLRFIVDFPFPDEASRARIWRGHFPAAAPLSDAMDYALLARALPLAGGSIKNIVLNAAFFAAEHDEQIGMEHVLRGARREFEKIGKRWSEPAGNVPQSARH